MVSVDLSVFTVSAYFLLIFGLTTRSFSIRTLFFLVLTALVAFGSFFLLPTRLDAPPDLMSYSYNSLLTAIWVGSIDFLLLRNPHEELHQIGQRTKLGYGPGEISSAPLLTRFRWASNLVFTPRGISWNFCPEGGVIRPPSGTSRIAFIAKQLFHAILGIALADLSGAVPRPEEGTWQSGLWYTFILWTVGVGIIAAYCVLSFIAIATFLSGPEDWPPIFGFWSDAWSLRRLWGRTWHQILRRRFQSIAQAVVKALGFKKGSKASSYGQLYLVFLQSGILHYVAEYVMLREWTQISILGYQTYLPATRSFWFFIYQAIGITIEDAVIGIYHIFRPQNGDRSSSPPLLGRLLGYAWVIFFLSLTIPAWQKPLLDVGMNYNPPSQILIALGISVVPA